MKDKTYPKVDYPTINEGFIQGELIRLESIEGPSELFISRATHSQLFNSYYGFLPEKNGTRLRIVKPFEFDGKTWGVTHLQKQSRYGYLIASPEAYHRWFFLIMQSRDQEGNWIPGTELGAYCRKGVGPIWDWDLWRWDVAGTMIDGELRHWITSTGFLGGHWD